MMTSVTIVSTYLVVIELCVCRRVTVDDRESEATREEL